jgi:pyruvate/2-oxoglutarate dehydrogenase complex dihydrolipoamide acyltransferase (E2) component
MPIELKMPSLSPTMEEGTLARWLVKEGDSVSSGDLIAEIETDKATMEFEAVDEGVISQILVAEGTDGVKVGTVIAMIQGEDEGAAPVKAAPVTPAPAGAAVVATPAPKEVTSSGPRPSPGRLLWPNPHLRHRLQPPAIASRPARLRAALPPTKALTSPV